MTRAAWRDAWRTAREALRVRRRTSPRFGGVPLAGASLLLAIREYPCDPLADPMWSRAGLLVTWRAFRAWGEAGRPAMAWRAFRSDPVAKSRAMQALAVAARQGYRGHDLIDGGAAVLERWAS